MTVDLTNFIRLWTNCNCCSICYLFIGVNNTCSTSGMQISSWLLPASVQLSEKSRISFHSAESCLISRLCQTPLSLSWFNLQEFRLSPHITGHFSGLLYIIYVFIYFWLCWVFVAACRLSLVAVSGDYSSLRCTGFSLQWFLLLQSTGSRHTGFSSCGSWALERRLSSCGARA